MTSPTVTKAAESEASLPPPDIHLIIDQKDIGPIEPEEIRRLYVNGLIGPATLAWHPALDRWEAIEDLQDMSWVYAPVIPAQDPAPDYVLAGFAPRFAAGAIDLLLWFILAIAVGLPLGLIAQRMQGGDSRALDAHFDILAEFAALFYFVLPMSRIGGGATPGYSVMGLKLIDQHNLQAPGLIRTFVWYITTFVRFIGCLTFFIDTQHRMLHNIVSGTVVIVDSDNQRHGPRP